MLTTLTPVRFSDERLFEIWLPEVRFQLPHPPPEHDYLEWINRLFREFIRSLSDNQINEYRSQRFAFPPNAMQGGLEALYIGDRYTEQDIKCRAHDGTDPASLVQGYKGIVLYNHHYLSGMVALVYNLAGPFAAFLLDKGIDFNAFGIRRGDADKIQVEICLI